MKEYEIIGKDVYGTQAVTKNNTLNCSNCRYKDYDCSSMDCKDYFYLKDEELEKINNEKIIEFLDSSIKMCEEQAKIFYERGMENSEAGSLSMKNAYNNVKEFIKNK